MPSSPTCSTICVSLVFRSTRPWRGTWGAPLAVAAVMSCLPFDSMRIAAAAPWPSSPSTRASSARCGARIPQPGLRVLDDAQPLHEILRAEGRGEARRAPVGSTWFGPAT